MMRSMKVVAKCLEVSLGLSGMGEEHTWDRRGSCRMQIAWMTGCLLRLLLASSRAGHSSCLFVCILGCCSTCKALLRHSP